MWNIPNVENLGHPSLRNEADHEHSSVERATNCYIMRETHVVEENLNKNEEINNDEAEIVSTDCTPAVCQKDVVCTNTSQNLHWEEKGS